MKAHEICQKAGEIVTGERSNQHGPDLYKSFAKTAQLMSIYLDHVIDPEQVPMLMTLLKVSRSSEGKFNIDDYIDICGYASIAGQLKSEEEW